MRARKQTELYIKGEDLGPLGKCKSQEHCPPNGASKAADSEPCAGRQRFRNGLPRRYMYVRVTPCDCPTAKHTNTNPIVARLYSEHANVSMRSKTSTLWRSSCNRFVWSSSRFGWSNLIEWYVATQSSVRRRLVGLPKVTTSLQIRTCTFTYSTVRVSGRTSRGS